MCWEAVSHPVSRKMPDIPIYMRNPRLQRASIMTCQRRYRKPDADNQRPRQRSITHTHTHTHIDRPTQTQPHDAHSAPLDNRPYHGGQRCVKKTATCHVQFSFLIASHLPPTKHAVLLLCCCCLLSALQCHCLVSFQLSCYRPV